MAPYAPLPPTAAPPRRVAARVLALVVACFATTLAFGQPPSALGNPLRQPPLVMEAAPGPTAASACPHHTPGPEGACVDCGEAVAGATPMGPLGFGGFDPAGAGQGAPTSPWQGHASPTGRPWLMDHFDVRHSSTHGRAMGPGTPLRGTSWKNRPFWVSLDGGALFMLGKPAQSVRTDNDLVGALGLGWDVDHYWGAQVRVGWSTPELFTFATQTTSTTDDAGAITTSSTNVNLPSDDNLLLADFSLLYYPWGDSRTRPYYRFGIGLTDLEYFNDETLAIHQTLFTLPFGIGVKHQLSRWTTVRLELMNHLAIGQNETNTLNNVTLTAGFEWRFGGRPEGYWAWAPRGGGW